MSMNIQGKPLTLDDLCALVDMPKRTVRFYIQSGLVNRPDGETKAARYTQAHLEQLLTIKKWQQAGLSLERIGELLAKPGAGVLPPPRPRGAGTVEVWSHLVVADGVEISVEPGRAGLNPEQVRKFFRGVMALHQQLSKDNNDAN